MSRVAVAGVIALGEHGSIGTMTRVLHKFIHIFLPQISKKAIMAQVTDTCAYCGQSFTWEKRGQKTKKYCNRQCYATSMHNTPEGFWQQVEKTEGCWYWRGAISKTGYGVVGFKGKQHKAHRLAYELTYGISLGEMQGCHTCDNPICVRPDHIFPGTTYDNMHDMIRKGRANYVRGEAKARKGQGNGRAKLTEQAVHDIRQKRASGRFSAKELSYIYGVDISQIYRASRGDSWASACDAKGHIRQDRDFDPSNPQVHTHILTHEATP